MTTESEKEGFVEITLTAEQTQWFIEQLQENLDQCRLENEMLRAQITRLKEVER